MRSSACGEEQGSLAWATSFCEQLHWLFACAWHVAEGKTKELESSCTQYRSLGTISRTLSRCLHVWILHVSSSSYSHSCVKYAQEPNRYGPHRSAQLWAEQRAEQSRPTLPCWFVSRPRRDKPSIVGQLACGCSFAQGTD